MFPKIPPTSTPSWQALQLHYAEMKTVHMADLFEADKERFHKFSLFIDDILFDYSKNILTEKTMKLLFGEQDSIHHYNQTKMTQE